jgi:hypothetical protein
MQLMSLIPVIPYDMYVGICVIDNVDEFNKLFTLGNENLNLRDDFQVCKALTHFGYVEGILNDTPIEKVGQQCAMVVIMNSEERIKQITPGVLAHEYLHIVNHIVRNKCGTVLTGDTGDFGDESACYLMQLFVDNLTPIYESWLQQQNKKIARHQSTKFIPDESYRLHIFTPDLK